MDDVGTLRLYCGIALWIAAWIASVKRAQTMQHSTWLFGWIGLVLGPGGFLLTWVATHIPGVPVTVTQRLEDLAVAGSVMCIEETEFDASLARHFPPQFELLQKARQANCEPLFLEELTAWLRERNDTEALLLQRICGLLLALHLWGIVCWTGMAEILPTLASLFDNMNIPLPAVTRALLFLGRPTSIFVVAWLLLALPPLMYKIIVDWQPGPLHSAWHTVQSWRALSVARLCLAAGLSDDDVIEQTGLSSDFSTLLRSAGDARSQRTLICRLCDAYCGRTRQFVMTIGTMAFCAFAFSGSVTLAFVAFGLTCPLYNICSVLH